MSQVRQLVNMTPLVRVENLVKWFPRDRSRVHAVNGVFLELHRGEAVALVGESGCGKTTTARCLMRLTRPTDGSIYFDDQELTALSQRELRPFRRRMQMVFQDPVPSLNPRFTARSTISEPLMLHGLAKRAELEEKVKELVHLVHLEDEHLDRYPLQLSGGQNQRVAIARAIVSEPEVLLLDEPTANLDPISEAKIEELIRNIIHRYDTTIIMATHDMAQGQRLADRVGVLLNGKIQQTGDWREVFNSPRNRDVADFVGVENIIDGVIVSSEDKVVTIDTGSNVIEAISDYATGEEVCACIRPEDITLALSRISSSARNSFIGEIARAVSLGPLSRIEIDCGFPLIALVTKRSADELNLEKGKQVYASFKATGVHIIKKASS